MFWLTGAALAGAVVVGINSTYRGEPLKQLIEHTDCQVLVTATPHLDLLDGIESPIASDRTLLVDTAEHAERLAVAAPFKGPSSPVTPDRSEEHTSELQSLMRISYAVFCLKKNTTKKRHPT